MSCGPRCAVQSAELIGSFDGYPGPELVLSAQRVTGIDVFGAVMLRAAVEDRLARDPARRVTLVEPDDDAAYPHERPALFAARGTQDLGAAPICLRSGRQERRVTCDTDD